VTPAYRSALALSSTVPAGLLMRQAHHWAADVFVAAMVLHLLRVFFTGAFRRPRELLWVIGVALLGAGLFEGFAGYSLPDDLMSGMGLAIAYGVALSLPLIGGEVGSLAWDGQYPGPGAIESRLFIVHVFVVPAVMATLIALHLALVARHHHTQFPGPGRREDNTVGNPMWPAYALRSTALMLLVFALLVALGGLVQNNPIWQWGPYEIDRSTNGAQPDWYLGWLIGGLRLMPNWEPVVADRTIVPNPFWGGAALPLAVFVLLFLWPTLERRVTGDRDFHHLLDRPRDAAWRTSIGTAVATFLLLVLLAGTLDRSTVFFGLSYTGQIRAFRIAIFVLPPLAGLVTFRTCRGLVLRDRLEAGKHAAEREARAARSRREPAA
jgi:ubiquinol-cytochrome c reductase cytochrome b subunit